MSGLDGVDHYSWRQVYVACHVGTADHEDTNVRLASDPAAEPDKEEMKPKEVVQ